MRILQWLIIVTLIFVVASCPVEPPPYKADPAETLKKQITYIKDNRTGLCFAKYQHPNHPDSQLLEISCKKLPSDAINID